MARVYEVTCSACGTTEEVNRVTVSRRKRKGETRCFKCVLASSSYKEKLLAGVKEAELAGRRVPHNKGKRVSEEQRQAMSEQTRKNWQNPELAERMKELIRKRMQSEEGRAEMRARWQNPEYRDKVLAGLSRPDVRAKSAIARAAQPSVSSLSLATSQLLTSLGVEHKLEHALGPWNFDVFVPSHNLLIECQGEYWHSLPKSKRNDAAKVTYVEKYFPELKLAALRELEFHTEGRVEYRLKELLGIDRKLEAVDFAGLTIEPVTYDQASELYDRHYLKSCRGNLHFGLHLSGKLIGACSFGPFQRNEQTLKYEGAVDLTRFWLDPSYQVKNLGSWFLSRCLKRIGKDVVTYADTTMGHTGALYRASNFQFSHTVDPSYHYVTDAGWVIHKRSVWERAKKRSMGEAEYAEANALRKVLGLEKLCFIYHKR